jgi:vacuolar protein sorting-associated protein 45
MSKMTKNFMTSVQGVENVYAQHVPLIMDTVQTVMKGKLAARTHPIVPGSCTTRLHGDTVVPEEIMIFMVGGVTYEEGTKIAEFNMQMKGRVHVILGGSTVHNSTSFLDELRSTSL